MVIKKNGSVLRNLTRWAKSLSPVDPDLPIPAIPLLVIDDEADYASVNTRPMMTRDGEDMDPTMINRRIRELINSFAASAYVGYTATPFANIFIFPDQEGGQFGEDLFPRDFLISLPVPSNHVGPTKIFGLYADSASDIQPIDPLPLVITVDDHTTHLPNVHKKDLVVDNLPESMKEAIRAFIIVCAARAARGTTHEHNSMLIHVTRFVNVQTKIAELVGLELRDLQNRIRYGDGASPTPILNELEAMWARWGEGDRQAALEAIPDSLVDELIIHGPPEACREHIQRFVDNGVDTPALAIMPFGMSPLEAMRALAPAASS